MEELKNTLDSGDSNVGAEKAEIANGNAGGDVNGAATSEAGAGPTEERGPADETKDPEPKEQAHDPELPGKQEPQTEAPTDVKKVVMQADVRVIALENNGSTGDKEGFVARVEPVNGDHHHPNGFSIGMLKVNGMRKLEVGKVYNLTITE